MVKGAPESASNSRIGCSIPKYPEANRKPAGAICWPVRAVSGAGTNHGPFRRDSNADEICRYFWPCYLCAFADGAIAFIDLDDHWGCRVRRARHELKRFFNKEVADRDMMCRSAIGAYHPAARRRFDGVG